MNTGYTAAAAAGRQRLICNGRYTGIDSAACYFFKNGYEQKFVQFMLGEMQMILCPMQKSNLLYHLLNRPVDL